MRLTFTMIMVLGMAYGTLLIANRAGVLPQAVKSIADSAGIGTSGAPRNRMYKWRDTNGSMVVSDQPPPADVKAEVIEYQRDAAPAAAQASGNSGSASIYSAEGLNQLKQKLGTCKTNWLTEQNC
jgi:hypothetical protein